MITILADQIDVRNSPEVVGDLRPQIDPAGTSSVPLDLADLPFVDSGLGALLLLRNELVAAGAISV